MLQVEGIVNDVVKQITNLRFGYRYFPVAVDESVDVCATAQLSIFIRAASKDFYVTEELPVSNNAVGQQKVPICLKISNHPEKERTLLERVVLGHPGHEREKQWMHHST